MICDRIISQIRRSAFLVADVTRHRQGVDFEAGYARALGIPVIWTCQKREVNRAHFATRQYNHIRWETPEELAAVLDIDSTELNQFTEADTEPLSKILGLLKPYL